MWLMPVLVMLKVGVEKLSDMPPHVTLFDSFNGLTAFTLPWVTVLVGCLMLGDITHGMQVLLENGANRIGDSVDKM